MVRKRRTELPGTGESSESQEPSGSGGRGAPRAQERAPMPQTQGGRGGGGRGWGSPGPHHTQQQGGRGVSRGGGYQPRGGMPHQYPQPPEHQGRGAYQPRGSVPSQQSYGRGGGSMGGGRGGGPSSYNPSRPPHPELHQAQPFPSTHPSTSQASSSQLHEKTSEMGQQLQQLSLEAEVASSETTRAIVPVAPSSKSIRFPLRPGKGSSGTRCIVKANHFFAELPNKDLHQYDVCFYWFGFFVSHYLC